MPQPGNAGSGNFWRVIGLTNGTYYWSVQAIDPSFAGSPFATESTLVVSRPVISALTNRSMLPNSTLSPVPFTVSDAETAGSNLVVTVTSSDTNVVAPAGLVLSGTDTNRTLTITPAADRSGIVTITVFAADERRSNRQPELSAHRRTLRQHRGRTARRSRRPSPGVTTMAMATWTWCCAIPCIRNNGAGMFTSVATLPAVVEGSANWGDYDNDGDLDLLVTGSNASRILRNEGNGTFVDIVAGLAAPSTFGASAWGDFDNDGDLDLVVAGSHLEDLSQPNEHRFSPTSAPA